MPNMHGQASHGKHARSHQHEKVVSLCERRRTAQPKIIRLSPEYDGIELLYANDRQPDKLFSLRVLAWAMLDDGEITALVPWLKKVVQAPQLADPLNGRWVGFRLPESAYLFTEAPPHKLQELEAAAEFFGTAAEQQIPDIIGTHAVLSDDGMQTISLVEVVSWRLDPNGEVQAMIADEELVTRTPVLPGDPCLVPVESMADFRYFFQHGIANRIKDQDPEALAAIATLAAEQTPR